MPTTAKYTATRIGATIRKLRLKNGLTQTQLGEKIGTTKARICRWESGVYVPRLHVLAAIAKAMNCDLSEIIS